MPIYILILGFTIVIDYFAGIYIEKSTGKKRRLLLIVSLIANIGVLAIFKYFNFINDNFSVFLNQIGYQNTVPNLSIILPVGLSFHTFQAMSYTIEVYRGNQKAEKHFGIYSLYVMFFPQLVAGPIERPQNILHQFYKKQAFNYQNATDGLKLMAWGFFKKIVIADRLSMCVNTVYNQPSEFYGLPLIMATVFFAFQIYCDFSGYSDIAIGSARILGFDLMKNFNTPYLSKSVSEFWKRWHISLSTWFRDYLYISLGGNRVGKSRLYFNLIFTFTISGLWHGANWTYVVWGGLNGLFLVLESNIEDFFSSKIKRLRSTFVFKCFKIIITFGLICFTWIFFRANSITDAIYIVNHLFYHFNESIAIAFSQKIGFTEYDFIVAIASLFVLFVFEILQSKNKITVFLNTKPVYLRWAAYICLITYIVAFGVFDAKQQFIYFQF